MTAEVADGWLPLFYLPEKVDDVWGDDLARRRRGRGPTTSPRSRSWPAACWPWATTPAQMRDLARPMIALYVGRHGRPGPQLLQRSGPPLRLRGRGRVEIQDLYLDGKKDEAAAAVPDGLLEAATICGPEGYVRDRIAAYKAAGVTSLNVTPIAADVPALVTQLKDWATHA